MADEPTLSAIGQLVAKLPEWLRHDLASRDKKERVRAEETLVAMIMTTVGRPSVW